MNNSGVTAYQTTKIDTADQGRLILIAYDVAIKHCKISMELFGDYHKIEERARHLMKAQDAISELMGALKMDVGDVASNLHRLYEYFLHRLIQANVDNEVGYVKEIVAYLEDLRDAWNQAIRIVKQQATGVQAPAADTTPAPRSFAISG